MHEGPAKRDRAAEGDAATAIMDRLGAGIPLRGRIFLRKVLLSPSRSRPEAQGEGPAKRDRPA